jgi:glucitol operon activator protein
MQFTQSALLMLLLFWMLQIAGSWIQWKHYRAALGSATQRWSDGYVGMGRAKSRFGFGVIALLEVSPNLEVRSLQAMSGITVFARFKPIAGVQHCSQAELSRRYAAETDDSKLARAVRQAITQVEEVRSRKG